MLKNVQTKDKRPQTTGQDNTNKCDDRSLFNLFKIHSNHNRLICIHLHIIQFYFLFLNHLFCKIENVFCLPFVARKSFIVTGDSWFCCNERWFYCEQFNFSENELSIFNHQAHQLCLFRNMRSLKIESWSQNCSKIHIHACKKHSLHLIKANES